MDEEGQDTEGRFDTWFPRGLARWQGDGVPKDYAKAVQFFKRSVENRATDKLAGPACLLLAKAYEEGLGVIQDDAEAVRYLQLAAQEGVGAVAHSRLARAYETGTGAKQNFSKALVEFRKAAAAGDEGDRKRLERFENWYNRFQRANRAAALWLTAFLLAAAASAAIWPAVPLDLRLPIILVLAALGLWAVFVITRRSGRRAQDKVFLQFFDARQAKLDDVRIGGRRWVVVDGEFHHLAHDGGERGRTFKPETGHDIRYRMEIGSVNGRREILLFCVSSLVACAILISLGMYVGIAALIAACFFLGGLYCIVKEYLYRKGYQFFHGAMVLDPAPKCSGRGEVARQRAHGDARLALEAEVIAAASGSAKSASIHQQEF